MKYTDNYYWQVFILLCSFGVLLMWHQTLTAAPVAADLLRACENSLNAEFQGIEGELCTWYVTPCDCDYGKSNDLPRVCLPEAESTESLARTVIAGLRETPGLLDKPADYAAAIILSREYPCTE